MTPNIFLKNCSGIYGIRNIENNKIYVGKTKCMYRRCYQYVYDFENRSIGHLNDYLYNSMCKSGIDKFEFFPLEFAPLETLSDRELYWIIHLDSTNRNRGYNIRLDSSTGMVCSESTSYKISESLKKQWLNGVRDGHSDKMKSSWRDNDDRKMKQSILMTQTKTRYQYIIKYGDNGEPETCNYSRLKELGLQSVMSSFHRHDSNVAVLKGFVIARYPIGENHED